MSVGSCNLRQRKERKLPCEPAFPSAGKKDQEDYMILGVPRPLVLTVAPNGPMRTKSDHLAMPVDLDELANAARTSCEAGASLFLLSLKEPKAGPCFDPDRYAEAVEKMREAGKDQLSIILDLQLPVDEDRSRWLPLLTHAKADLCQVALDDLLPRDGDETHEACAREFFDICEEEKIKVQLLLRQPGDVDWFYAYRQYGVLPESCRSLVLQLGMDGDEAHCNPHQLRDYLTALDKQYLLGKVAWSVAAFGPEEIMAQTAAIALGGHVQTGFAYNIHRPDGELALTNAEQVERLAKLAGDLARPAASRFEATTLLFGGI